MTSRKKVVTLATGLLAAAVSTALLAQQGGFRGRGGNANVEVKESRLTPAEDTIDPNYKAPRTSWGAPAIAGIYSTDDMRGINTTRDAKYGTSQSLDEEDFLARARSQQSGRTSSVESETFLRNEWGTRTFGFNSLVIEPENGQYPALKPTAAQGGGRGGGSFGGSVYNTFQDFSLYDRCIALGIKEGMGSLIYGNGIQVEQSPDSVSITYEMIHETRVIPLDDRPHLDILQYTGNGRGHWEGDTLVIDSAGYNDQLSVGRARPSPSFHTTERIRRVKDDMLEYKITVDDPEVYEEPWTLRTMWTTQPNYAIYEYTCHETNFIGHALNGERTYERQVAEAIAKGEPIPARSSGMGVYGAPSADAQIYDINAGE